MKKTAALLLLAALAAEPALAGEYEFCLLVNRIAPAGKLRDYSNAQIENGVCMTSKELVSAITSNDAVKQRICGEAAEHMVREFKRRFPTRQAKEAAGRC